MEGAVRPEVLVAVETALRRRGKKPDWNLIEMIACRSVGRHETSHGAETMRDAIETEIRHSEPN